MAKTMKIIKMKTNKNKQKGATFITWMIVAAIGILIFSAGLKVGPSYLEYNAVRSMMDSIAAEPGIKGKNKRYVYAQLNKYININSMYSVEEAMAKQKVFKVSPLRKGNGKRLTAHYEVRRHWLGNLSYLIDFKYSVILGEKNS
ncbi:MAG TPA: DUF4845 domain-containing protein [Leucothrix mucor]|uniref:DUF4845 domain-containing protein n=1 Tax=Leucothrix mucor TaxID=45248 RepID=A0A7V2SZP6_LEUMU|nr:DUF4845 domain-containing protein [Leucothrix mucor]